MSDRQIQIAFGVAAQIGEQAKRKGMDKAEDNAGDFVPTMRAVATRLAAKHGSVTSDDLRQYAAEHGIEPHHPNCWGVVFRTGFRCIGRRKSRWASAHAREVKVWAL